MSRVADLHAVVAAAVVVALAGAAAGCGGSSNVGTACAGGTIRCQDNVYQQCADDGDSWVVVDDCAADGQLCSLAQGCLTCVADTRSCDGADIVRCRPDSSGYDVIASCDPAAGQLCVGGACVDACARAGEIRSYEGCEYWAVDLDNAVVATQGAAAAQQFSVVLSNAGDLPATVTVEILCTPADAASPALGCTAGEPFIVEGPFALAPGDLAIVDLDPREVDGSSRPELNDGPGTFRSDHAYRISSTAPLIAYQFNPLENVGVFSNDASLLLPTGALADRYLVLSWPQTLALTDSGETNGGIDLRAFLTIVGVEDQTTVRIGLSTAVLGGGGVGPASAGDQLEVVIDRFEVLNLETDGFDADFTGTSVTADRPIAVFTGSEASDVPRFDTLATRQCCADHLEEQLFPEVALGTLFVAVKSPLRSSVVERAGWDVSVVPDEPEYWRVLASEASTTVTTDLPPPWGSFELDRGESMIIESERDFVLQATGPVAFGQFPASQQATGIPSTLGDGIRPPGGDPSYMLVPPIEQWRDRYLFLVPNKYAFDYLLIAATRTADLRYDGIALDAALQCDFEPIAMLPVGPGADEVEYLAIRCPLSAPDPSGPGLQDDGVHLLESGNGEPFGLVVWGWDSFVSYGYPGGSNVEPINLE